MHITKFPRSIGAALLAVVGSGCEETSRPIAPSPKPAVVAEEPFQIRAASADETTARTILDELRIQLYTYDLKAPINHRVTFWMEVWRDGKLDQSLSIGHCLQPPREKPLFGRVVVSLMDGQSINSPKARWSTRLESYTSERLPGTTPAGMGTAGDIRWVDDPFKSAKVTQWGGQAFGVPTPFDRGRTYNLHAIAGTRAQPLLLPAANTEPAEYAGTVAVAIFLRARIERVPTARLRDSTELGSTDVPPVPLKD